MGLKQINELTATSPSLTDITISRGAAVAGGPAKKITWQSVLDLFTSDNTIALHKYETIVIAISDETTAITTGTAKVTFRMPYAFIVHKVKASLSTSSSSGIPTFDINEGGVSILSTKLTIDANELTSKTAATAAVVSDSALADDAEITIDIDTAGTGAKGAKIYIVGYKTALPA